MKTNREDYLKDYYVRNKQRILERQKEYSKKNKDKIDEYRKKYDSENKDKILNRQRVYEDENREHINERKRKSGKIWRSKNKEKITETNKKQWVKNKTVLAEKVKEWGRNNPDNIKNYILKRKYNITVNEYNEMFEAQKGCCAICGTHQSKFKKALHVDHCHSLKQVRSLLCVKCNNGLGNFKDDITLLQKAIKYLTSFYA